MSDIKLFNYNGSGVTAFPSRSAPVERWLQQLIERHMEAFLGVRFLASEFSTSRSHRGRIDTLGLDENNCPVIVEYKRGVNENVINQGLFYLDWLNEHQADFRELVREKLGNDVADNINENGTRLLCIAADFTRYDEYAVQQIDRSIELIRYRLFSEDLIMFELVNTAERTNGQAPCVTQSSEDSSDVCIHLQNLGKATQNLQELYQELCEYIRTLGDDVQEKQLKHYIAFKRLKNFACVNINHRHSDANLVIWLKADPTTVELIDGFSRDVSNIGHLGTGNLELTIRNAEDIERAKPFFQQSYDNC